MVPIIINPEILSNNITSGLSDPFFWIIILFLIWFLFYCANSPAFILLFSFKIIQDIKNDRVFNYDPLIVDHHKSLEHILKLCNKAVCYTCSALLFLPLAIYYIFQEPKLIFDFNTYTLSEFEFSNSDSKYIILIWVSCILVVFSIFLFSFIFYPTYAIKKYIKKKSNEKILIEETKYVAGTSTIILPKVNVLYIELYKYNTYLRLQEIKVICKSSLLGIKKFDRDIVLTYCSIIITLVCSVPGFWELIK